MYKIFIKLCIVVNLFIFYGVLCASDIANEHTTFEAVFNNLEKDEARFEEIQQYKDFRNDYANIGIYKYKLYKEAKIGNIFAVLLYGQRKPPLDFLPIIDVNKDEGAHFYNNGDYVRALQIWKNQKKTPVSLINLAHMQSYGLANQKSEKLAYESLTKAALLGSNDAQYVLGRYYLVINKTNEGLSWLNMATKDGYIDAIAELGNFYSLEGNYEKSNQYLHKAYSMGQKEAGLFLYYHYKSGLGVKKSPVKAVEFLKESAVRGSPRSQKKYAQELIKKGRINDAILYLEKSIQNGEESSIPLLTELYLGKGTAIYVERAKILDRLLN